MNRCVPFIIVSALAMLSGCSDTGGVSRKNPVDCSNKWNTDMPSEQIFGPTLELWERAFVAQYFSDANCNEAIPLTRYVEIDAETLEDYLNQKGATGPESYQGLKAYLALDSSATTNVQTFENLCLILVPYKVVNGTVDTIVDVPFTDSINGDFFVRLRPESPPNNLDSVSQSEAQTCINNWAHHYDSVELSIMVRISSFVITRGSLEDQIDTARQAPNDGRVYLTYGFHTIGKDDANYCVANSPAYSGPNVSGFAVNNLMLSTVDTSYGGSTIVNSTDFLRPCPRYCGKPLFTSHF